jgi:hypothetical protein
MNYLTVAKKAFSLIIDLGKTIGRFLKSDKTLQPKKVAEQLEIAMERGKKVMIDGTYAPNYYLVYLSPMDMVEMRPLMKSLQSQLKGYITDKILKKGYRIITDEAEIAVKENLDQKRNQVYVDAVITDGEHRGEKSYTQEAKAPAQNKPTHVLQEEKMTKIVEDKKTRILDESKVKLEIISGEETGRTLELSAGEYTFGRGNDATIVVKDTEETVSRLHFIIKFADKEISLRNLDSTNGTYVNGERVETASISEGDIIKAGLVIIKVVDIV